MVSQCNCMETNSEKSNASESCIKYIVSLGSDTISHLNNTLLPAAFLG